MTLRMITSLTLLVLATISCVSGPASANGVQVVAQFLESMTVQGPKSPDLLKDSGGHPQINVNVKVNANPKIDGDFHVSLTIEANIFAPDGEPLMELTATYGGIFTIAEGALEAIYVECPRFLFPFLRELISRTSLDLGLPSFRIDPIDFDAMFRARVQ